MQMVSRKPFCSSFFNSKSENLPHKGKQWGHFNRGLLVFEFFKYFCVFGTCCVDTSACMSYIAKVTCLGNFVGNALSSAHYTFAGPNFFNFKRVALYSLQLFQYARETKKINKTTFSFWQTPWKKSFLYTRSPPSCIRQPKIFRPIVSSTFRHNSQRYTTTPLRKSELRLPYRNTLFSWHWCLRRLELHPLQLLDVTLSRQQWHGGTFANARTELGLTR